MLKWGEALVAIDKLLASKKTKFISGPQGLQAVTLDRKIKR